MAVFIYFLYTYREREREREREKFIYPVCQYINMVKRLCISVSDEEAEWMDMNKVSPSRLLQEEIKRVKEIMQTSKEIFEEMQLKIEVREEKILKLGSIIQDMQEKIDVLEKERAVQ